MSVKTVLGSQIYKMLLTTKCMEFHGNAFKKFLFFSLCLQPKHGFRVMLSKVWKCRPVTVSDCSAIVFCVTLDHEFARDPVSGDGNPFLNVWSSGTVCAQCSQVPISE